ncbi:hypothetical protein T01_9288 [Trichinella spiralis]|uniref:Uncharacterized protein n=1 Tax=Trichinella spiralis TaxID=6334 RepID=A0A0V1AZ06_TRISP|nr:hypothetical protein T01_9288 [Trichinella spiralis]
MGSAKIQDIECDPLHDWVICSIGGRFQLSLFWRAAFPSRVPLFKINFKLTPVRHHSVMQHFILKREHKIIYEQKKQSHFRVCGGKFSEPVTFTCAHDLHNQ